MGGITAAEGERLDTVYARNRERWAAGDLPVAELFYLGLFHAAVGRSGLAVPPLYPVGPAANASLLYLLFRLAEEFPGLDLLELGAGQSSLLLDALSRAHRLGTVITLEHDPDWAERVRRRVGDRVVHAPLRRDVVHGIDAEVYDLTLDRRYDAVLVDGPVGTPKHSRWGTLKLLAETLADEFIVLFDDAERPGERDTIAKFLELRPSAGHSFVHAMKSQCLVFTEKYRAAASF